MNNYPDELEILIKLPSDKLEQLTQICQQDNISLNLLLHQLINEFLDNKNNSDNSQPLTYDGSDINKIVERAIAPLIERIETLEKKLQNQSKESKSKNIPPLKPSKNIPEEQRKYLPRHEVWQILKKTSFVQHSGYDNFLKATPQELEAYDIFFDSHKKRFYIEEKNPDHN
ncbi:MAG: hypothetical protein ACXITR_03045 [Cyanobacterium sp.]